MSISNSYASGAVSGCGGSIIGGFVCVLSQGQISTSYATGAVTQAAPGQNFASDLVGGFAGVIVDTATVSQSYSSGAVTAVGGPASTLLTFAGGFVGDVDGTAAPASVSDSYSLSAVSETGPNSFAGGFAGLATAGADIERVYAAGRVAGEGPTAGVVGLALGGVVGNGYWDEGTTGQTVGVQFDGGTDGSVGLTTSGANGYYYYLLAPGTMATSTSNNVGALLYAPGGSPLLGLGYNGGGSLADGSMTGLDIADADPLLRTSATAYSALTNDLSATFGAAVYHAATSALGRTAGFMHAGACVRRYRQRPPSTVIRNI